MGFARSKKDLTARLISDLMNPLFVPPVVIGILSWLLGSGFFSWFTGMAILFYTLVPLASAFYLLYTSRISSLDLPERQPRQKIYALSIASAAMASVCFFLMVSAEHQLIATISLVFPINASIGFAINKKWKISVHAAALSTAGAIFLSLSGGVSNIFAGSAGQILYLSLLLLLLLIMAWARYRLNIHTLAELFGGAASGFLLTFLQLTILINIW